MSPNSHPVSVTKHFVQGSAYPEKKPNSNIIRLYSMKYCPYAQRTRLVLAAKKIPNEVVNVNLRDMPDWYEVKNPLCKVPCLEFADGQLIYESLVTSDYLDEVYPDRPLNRKDPLQKAQDRMLLELFSNKVVTPMFVVVYKFKPENDSVAKAQLAPIHEGLQIFETELEKRATSYFGGDEPGMFDYMIWPFIERLPSFTPLTQGVIQVSFEKFPLLAKWFQNMKEDDAVKESYVTPEIQAKFLKDYIAAKELGQKGFNYDFEP